MPSTGHIQPETRYKLAFLPRDSVLRNRTFLAVSLSIFAAYAGIGMVGPVRVLFAETRGASLAILSAMTSAYLVSNFLFQYPLGWLADRSGRRPVLVTGLLVQAVISVLYLQVTDPIVFIVLRSVEGIGAAAILPSARALIIDAVQPEQQGEAFGIFGAFFNAGFLLGPGIGGLLATTGYASAFIGSVIGRVIALILILAMIRTPKRDTIVSQKAVSKVSYREIFKLALLGAYIIAFGDYLYLGFDLTLMPLWLHDHLGASVVIIGLAYVAWSIPNILLAPFGGRLADRHRRSWIIFICGLIQVPIYITYGLVNSALIVVVIYGIHSAVYAFIQPAIDAHVATSSSVEARGRIQGMYSTIGLIGSFVGSSGFTPLYTINFRYPLFAMGAGYCLCLLLGWLLIRRSERSKYIKSNLLLEKELGENVPEMR